VTVYDYVEDISEMYDIASVFCRPSYSEGLPLTMLEAMASGVPPVVTAIAGVPEVVTDRETGILLEPGKPDDVEEAITELFDDVEFQQQLSQNAREYVVENLTWEQRTEKVMKVYNKIVVNE
jgi:glycosyltransferase involved in cell wall biosynthesis